MLLQRIIHTLCVLAAVVVSGTAVRAARLSPSEAFANLPLDVVDLIRPSERLDMIDYYVEADSLAPVSDALGGTSRLEVMAPDYMRVAVTPVSTLEIKLLPLPSDTVVMTLYTIGGDGIAADTEVKFFDRNMKPLPVAKFLKLPATKDFFKLKGSEITSRKLEDLLRFSSIKLSTGPSDTPLTAEFTSVGTLPDETASILQPLLQPKVFIWTGKKYK